MINISAHCTKLAIAVAEGFKSGDSSRQCFSGAGSVRIYGNAVYPGARDRCRGHESPEISNRDPVNSAVFICDVQQLLCRNDRYHRYGLQIRGYSAA